MERLELTILLTRWNNETWDSDITLSVLAAM